MRSPLVFQLLCLALLKQLSTAAAANLTVASAEYTADLHSFVTVSVIYFNRSRIADANYLFYSLRLHTAP
jgi:hypothetical protein